jgi:hypothetical protein
MHSDPSSPPRERLAHDAITPGLTLHDLRSYYDSLPDDAASAVLAPLISGLRHLHGYAEELEKFIASAKRIGKTSRNE